MKAVAVLALVCIPMFALAQKRGGDGPGNSIASTPAAPVVFTGRPLAKGKLSLTYAQTIKMSSDSKGSVVSTTLNGEASLSARGRKVTMPLSQTTSELSGTIEIVGDHVVETDSKGRQVLNKILRNDATTLIYRQIQAEPIPAMAISDGVLAFSHPKVSDETCVKRIAEQTLECHGSVSADAAVYASAN